MSEIKRGAVVLIQAGDPEISGAIAEAFKAQDKVLEGRK